MYDLLIVGTGISSATICATLKDKLRICVIDIRPHLGGNCFDYKSSGSYIHQYGPHIFHSTSPEIVKFLSKYTEWNEYEHSASAEIEWDNKLVTVPFPYSQISTQVLGREWTEDEILQKFFHGYSKKMWGMEWDDLPKSIKGRVPKNTLDRPVYFPNQFVGLPKHGYTRMIENMFDGVKMRLGAGPREWETIPAKQIVYCGRLDHLRFPGTGTMLGEKFGFLPHRSLHIELQPEEYMASAPCLNFCHEQTSLTRKTCYYKLTGGTSNVVSSERPYQAKEDDPTPYYPIPIPVNWQMHHELLRQAQILFPTMKFCGRLATYKYLDVYQAVAQAQVVAKQILIG